MSEEITNKYIDGSKELGKEGYWKHYYRNGKVSYEGNYVNGYREGYWKEYYNNGTLSEEGYFKNGYKIEWKDYYFDAEDSVGAPALCSIIKYINDNVKYSELYYIAGPVFYKGYLINNDKRGCWIYFYPSGEIQEKNFYL